MLKHSCSSTLHTNNTQQSRKLRKFRQREIRTSDAVTGSRVTDLPPVIFRLVAAIVKRFIKASAHASLAQIIHFFVIGIKTISSNRDASVKA